MPEYRIKLFRGYWHAVWSDAAGDTRRASLRTEDREEAERRLIDFKRDMEAPIGATVGEIMAAYLEDKKGRVHAHERLVYAWKRAKPTFGALRPDQCTRAVSRQYAVKRRAEGVSDGTILKEINTVRQGINWAKAPGAVFEAPSQPAPRDRHLTKTEFDKLLAGCEQPHVRLFVVLALSTAGRKQAILDLTWTRVDFERNQIRLGVVGESGRKGRATVAMTDRARAELEEAQRAAVTPYVIEYGGKKVGNIKKGFGAAVKRAGLVDVVPHDLRHTAAVWMAESGTSMAEIAQVLGHSDERITFRIYARYSPDHLRRAMTALEF
jgi:integrase